MKPKKIEKKLTLNKKTISNLRNREMNDVHGGSGTQPGCSPCAPTRTTLDLTRHPGYPCCH